MSTKIHSTKDARLQAQKLRDDLKLAETTDDAEEKEALFSMALVRCRKVYEYLQGRKAGKVTA